MEFEKKIIKVDDLCERFDEKCSRRAVLNDLAKKSKKTTGWFYKYIYNIEIISIAVISIILFILLSYFNDTATTEIYTLSLHDALPIYFSSNRSHRSSTFIIFFSNSIYCISF